jgi:hypothetical protein
LELRARRREGKEDGRTGDTHRAAWLIVVLYKLQHPASKDKSTAYIVLRSRPTTELVNTFVVFRFELRVELPACHGLLSSVSTDLQAALPIFTSTSI